MNINKLSELLYKNFKNGLQLSENIPIVDQYNETDYKLYINPPKIGQYNRTLVTSNDYFDIYIITWQPNSKTPIHDHASQGCILKLLQGNLTETVYDCSLEIKKVKNVYENMISFITNNIGYHLIENNSIDMAVSIHVYSPSNYKANIYNIK